MRTIFPQPGKTAQQLKDLLASKQFIFADCFTIYPKVGDPLRYTTAQRRVDVYPNDAPAAIQYFYSDRVKVSGLQMRAGIGVEVDEQTLIMDFDKDYVYYGMSMAQAIKFGRLDGSTVRRDRYFAPNWGTPNSPIDWIGGVPMFQGRFSTVERVSRSSAEFKVKSHLLLLNMQMPRNLYQAMCNNTFGDVVCGVNRQALEVATTVGAGSDALTIYTAAAAANMKYGTAHFQDQYNVTQIRTIKEVIVGSRVILAAPLDFAPGIGEVIKLYPGCPRTFEACRDLYNNTSQFRGFPAVPTPETAF